MPVRNVKLVVSPIARRDTRAVILYTERTWGKAQRKTYRTLIDAALDEIRSFPGMGNLRPEYGEYIRSLPVRQHVMLYHSREDQVLVVRVTHSSRDWTLIIHRPPNGARSNRLTLGFVPVLSPEPPD